MGMLLDFAVSRRVEGFSNLVKAEDTGPDSVILPITSCDPGGVTGPLGTTTAKDCGSCPASSLPSFAPRVSGRPSCRSTLYCVVLSHTVSLPWAWVQTEAGELAPTAWAAGRQWSGSSSCRHALPYGCGTPAHWLVDLPNLSISLPAVFVWSPGGIKEIHEAHGLERSVPLLPETSTSLHVVYQTEKWPARQDQTRSCFRFETGSWCVAQAGLKAAPLSPEHRSPLQSLPMPPAARARQIMGASRL